MSKPNPAPHGTPPSSHLLTTLLACAWGLASAYTLFHALINTHDPRLFLASLIPLVAVWATLERKRWGRLALLGLSATAMGLFAALLGSVAKTMGQLKLAEQHSGKFMELILAYFDNRAEIALSVFVLALTTGLWLRRPAVVAEFERGKKATLAVAQRAIAMSLVAFWGVTVLLSSPTQKQGEKQTYGKTSDKASNGRKSGTQKATLKKTASRR